MYETSCQTIFCSEENKTVHSYTVLVCCATFRLGSLLQSVYPQDQHLEHLQQQVSAALYRRAEKQAQRDSLQRQQQQRTVASGVVNASGETLPLGSDAVRAAQHDATASNITRNQSSDTRVRLAKKFSIFDRPISTPRPLHNFQHFASICYCDLHDVIDNATNHHDVKDSTAEATGMGVPSGPRDGPMQGVGMARQRRRTRQIAPIDTASHNVTLRGLALEFMHQTASDMSVPESEVCWFMDTGQPISPTLNLAYSSSLSSKECWTSALFNFVNIALQASLHLAFGAPLLLHCTVLSVQD